MNATTPLEHQRELLEQYFLARAKVDGVPLHFNYDVHKLDTGDHLLEDHKSARQIIIAFSPKQKLTFDYYFKPDAFYGENKFHLLYIAVKDPEKCLETIWSMYSLWIHEGRPQSYIESTFGIA